VCTIAWLVALATAIDRVFLGDADLAEVRGLLVALVLLLLVRAALLAAQEVLAERASALLRTRVRADLVSHLVAVGPAGLAQERVGEVSAVVGDGVQALDDYVVRFVPAAAMAVLGPAAVFVTVALLDPWTTLILLFAGPMLVLILGVIGGHTRELTRRRFDELAWLTSFSLDMIRGLGTLKAFGRSQDGAQAIEGLSRRFGSTTMDVLRTAFQTSLVMEWAATAATALVAVEVSFRLVLDVLPFGVALAVLVLTPEFFMPFRRLSMEYHAGQAGRAALARIEALHALPAAQPEGPAPGASAVARAASRAPALTAAPTIELNTVSYRYPDAAVDAVSAVSLRLEAGRTVALVGPSGAGKTTLARLLLQFVAPTQGQVLVDGVPLGKWDPADWRRHVAWVPQTPSLVAASVADNIRLGAPHATDDEVRQAAALARATSFVEALPQGFHTVLGERGLRLSGGQRQRLAIARAALRDAPVVVLDEMSAHLDATVEAEILAAMQALLVERTALVIAHRPRTLALAHSVIELREGRVAAHATTGERA
jgi:ATP-binding cassette subfamily C protein CydD